MNEINEVMIERQIFDKNNKEKEKEKKFEKKEDKDKDKDKDKEEEENEEEEEEEEEERSIRSESSFSIRGPIMIRNKESHISDERRPGVSNPLTSAYAPTTTTTTNSITSITSSSSSSSLSTESSLFQTSNDQLLADDKTAPGSPNTNSDIASIANISRSTTLHIGKNDLTLLWKCSHCQFQNFWTNDQCYACHSIFNSLTTTSITTTKIVPRIVPRLYANDNECDAINNNNNNNNNLKKEKNINDNKRNTKTTSAPTNNVMVMFSDCLWQYDMCNDLWSYVYTNGSNSSTTTTPTMYPTDGPAIVMPHQDGIYCIGGRDRITDRMVRGGRYIPVSLSADNSSKSMGYELPELHEPRCSAGIAYMKKYNSILVVGGDANGDETNTMEEYSLDIKNDQERPSSVWTYKAPMNIPRNDFACCVYENDKENKCGVVAIGGHSQLGFSDRCELYCYETNEWKELKPIPTGPRARCGACVIDTNQLVVVGGSSPYRRKCDWYDFHKDVWITCSDTLNGYWYPLVSPLKHKHSGEIVDNNIICVIGCDEHRAISSCEFYDRREGQWFDREMDMRSVFSSRNHHSNNNNKNTETTTTTTTTTPLTELSNHLLTSHAFSKLIEHIDHPLHFRTMTWSML